MTCLSILQITDLHIQPNLNDHFLVRIFGTPSTCFQFTPNSHNFSLDKTMPGYRLIKLNENGQIESEVTRLTGVLTMLQIQSLGY